MEFGLTNSNGTATAFSKAKTRADQLSPEKHRCIELMLDGWMQQDIAKELGVTPETISKWKKQRVFAREYNRKSKDVIAGGMSVLRASYTEACEKLLSAALNGGIDRIQLEALRSVIKLVNEGELVQEFSARLEKIEQSADREA